MDALDRDKIERAALNYLARYASSSENLRQVLRRRILRARDAAPADSAQIIADIVRRYLAAGLLDDAAYASQQAESLRRRGVSAEGIRHRLEQKGVPRDLIAAALGGTGGGLSELQAACALVRRRRIGPFRPRAARAANRARDLGVLARAGFPLELARRVLGAKDEAALARLAEGEEA